MIKDLNCPDENTLMYEAIEYDLFRCTFNEMPKNKNETYQI